MKQNLILLLLLIAIGAQSQGLEKLISNDSKAVVEVSGDQIFSLIDHADLEMLMPPDPSGAPMDLNQYGIDMSSKAYYFYQEIESIVYHNVIVSLSDVKKAKELIQSMSEAPITKINGYNFMLESNRFAAWNNKIAIFSTADFPKMEYTMDDLLEEKEKERNANPSEDSIDAYETDEEGYEMEEDEESLAFELMLKNMDAPSLFSDAEITDKMTEHFAYIVNTRQTQSITQNASYTGGKNNKSSAYFWIRSVDELIKDSYPADLASILPAFAEGSPNMISGIEAITGNLIFDTDEIKFNFNMGINPKLVPIYQKIYDSRIDETFLNHFNQNEVLAYMSFTMDMTLMLKEYPEMAKTLYGSMIPGYEEELDVALDVIEVFLDEEAIGELITGDGLFVLHDFEEQEVTYKTIEYDDDLNSNEVEKTKMESIPSFTIMMGSKNERIINKLMKLAIKYEVATDEGSYHRILSKDMGVPMDMYFVHQDGIIFFTNSQDRIGNYASGRMNMNLGKHKPMLENNIFNMYLDASSTMEHLSSLIPSDPETLEYIKDNYKEIYMTMGKMKDNTVGYDVVIKTNGAKGNSLKLIMDTMTSLQGM